MEKSITIIRFGALYPYSLLNTERKRIKLIFLFVLAVISVKAQNFNVSGIVCDQNKAPLSYCNVILKTADDSTFVKGCTTDDKGGFSLSISRGSYVFHVSFIGYDEYRRPIAVRGNMKMDAITLGESSVNLKELTIVGKRAQHNASSDVYYLKDSPKAMGRNALEVISLAAGVTVDHSKGIKIYGREGVRVMINDRMLEMTGDQLNTYLANIKGEDIASMEVIRSANATYDADASAGVVKIKLRSHQGNGYDASVGFKAQTYGTTLLGVSPDFSINSRVGKFNLYGNLSYNSIAWRETDTETSAYKGKNTGVTTDTRVVSKRPQDDYFFRLGSMYEINDRHSIGIDMDATFHRGKEESHTPSVITDKSGSKDYRVDYYTPDSIQKYNASVNYIWKIDESGSQLKVGADYYYQKSNTGDDNTMTCKQDGTFLNKIWGSVRYNRSIYTGGFDYKWVYSPVLTFDIGSKFGHTVMKDYLNYRYKDAVGSSWKKDAENTDDEKYKERLTAAFINGNYHKDNWTIEGGLRFEQTQRKVTSRYFTDRNSNKTFTDLFPMLNATYDIDKEKGHHLSFKFHSGIVRPTFDQLVPYTTQQNLYTYLVGNPNLAPSYNYTGGIDLLLFDAFYFGAGFTRDKDKVELIISPKDEDGLVMNAIYSNVKRVDTYSAQAYLPIPVGKDILLGVTLMGSNKKRNLYSGLNDKLWQFYMEADANINITKTLSFESTFSYANKDFYGNMTLKNYYTLSFALRESFLNKKLQVALNGTNILGRKRILYIDDNNISRRVTMSPSYDTSLFSLSVRYSFGGNAKVKENRVKAFNTEERNR